MNWTFTTGDELDYFDLTRQRVQSELAGRLPERIDPEGIAGPLAYWVCTSGCQTKSAWEETILSYVGRACQDPEVKRQADLREIDLLRQRLAAAPGPLLDIGAGWGRLAPLYRELGLPAVYLEPEALGVRLMHRSGLCLVVRGKGEALPFPSGAFSTAVIGWVLHHNEPESIDAPAILEQTARTMSPGGRLISTEPLSDSYTQDEWTAMLAAAGFHVEGVEQFFETRTSRGNLQWYTMAVCTLGRR